MSRIVVPFFRWVWATWEALSLYQWLVAVPVVGAGMSAIPILSTIYGWPLWLQIIASAVVALAWPLLVTGLFSIKRQPEAEHQFSLSQQRATGSQQAYGGRDSFQLQGGHVYVESHNQQGGITAYQVNLQPGDRQLTSQQMKQVRDSLGSVDFKSVEICAVMGDGEAFRFASQIKDFLVSEGIEIAGFSLRIQQASSTPDHTRA
jgi:hypothetical protein